MVKTLGSCTYMTDNQIVGNGYRFTVLTDRMIRMEYQVENQFLDDTTQRVVNREFKVVEYEAKMEENVLSIATGFLELRYTGGDFSKDSLSIRVIDEAGKYFGTWHYGDVIENLRGTARTLDCADGSIPLQDGLISRCGYAVIDDSDSAIVDYSMREGDYVRVREQKEIDLYFLGYGHDYFGCLKEFYDLCGQVPLIPKYMLGNWWSRYYKYTEKSYMELIRHFEDEKVPITVAVIDMDWHITNPPERFGKGWTGYTWNKEYFPDPERFLRWLHDKGLHTTLNVHPADGVRAFEDMYPQMAEAMGIEVESEKPVEFDITDSSFRKAYFDYIHHPYERMGVDFWWIDWQQGFKTKVTCLDPLWMLNHSHYQNMEDSNRRPVIFSRYAGLGSHRYPIGFSGDTIISWKSLQFQPYFTANASNVGYGWWSHDIGGHMKGTKDCEMLLRWIQLGVFSPIMRLHSSKNIFIHKEPWRLPIEFRTIVGEFMRLRHRMLPYLYTMNHRAHSEGIPLIQPLYYLWPENEEAYRYQNEYYFGSECIVSPITQPMDKELRMSAVETYLPKGDFIDLFTGVHYRGERTITMYRGLGQIPVLLKAGGILTFGTELPSLNSLDNPACIEWYYAAGADGSFTLYEDDGVSLGYQKGCFVETTITISYEKNIEISIDTPKGDIALLPEKRNYRIHILGIESCDTVEVLCSSRAVNISSSEQGVCVEIDDISYNEVYKFRLCNCTEKRNNTAKLCYEIIDNAWIPYGDKELVYNEVSKLVTEGYSLAQAESLISSLRQKVVCSSLLGAIYEVLSAD